MQYLNRINGIRTRAATLKVPLADVVAAAGVHYSTFHRWQQPDANPQLRVLTRALERMESHLDGCARQMAAHLLADSAITPQEASHASGQ